MEAPFDRLLVRVIERKNLRYINWLKSTGIEKGSRAISTSIVSYRSSQLKKRIQNLDGCGPEAKKINQAPRDNADYIV